MSPYPVTVGFTAGIAVVIGTLALNDLTGLMAMKTLLMAITQEGRDVVAVR